MKNKKTTGDGITNGIGSRRTIKRGLPSLIVLVLCAVILGCAFITARNAFAEGENTSVSVQVGELTLSGYDSSDTDGKVFNGANLHKLYQAILGEENASYEDLKERLYENGKPKTQIYEGYDVETVDQIIEVPYGVTSEDLRGENYGGNEITVFFGGIEWEVVYLTTASGGRDGHVIVDLWQKNGTEKSSFSGGTGYSKPKNTGAIIPSHMYSTSYIRSEALNTGSSYYTYEGNETELISDKEQSAQNTYAKFTMSNAALSETDNAGKSLIKYIAKPSELKYQEIESKLDVVGQAVDGTGNYCMPNEAYGTPWREVYYSGANSVNTGYGGNGKNQKEGYGDWANDYIWLPSWSEISEKYYEHYIGIWGLSQEQRVINDNIWLRTGSHDDAGKAYFLNSNGENIDTTNKEYFIRPALHLDLTEAEQAARQPQLVGITASFDESAKVYTVTTKSELKKYINAYLVYDNNETVETDDYDIENFTLKAGVPNKLKVVYTSSDGEFNCEVTVDGVEEAVVTQLTVEFDNSVNLNLYPYSDINDIKPYLTVKATFNYKDEPETIKPEDYALKINGKLTAGEAEIFVVYADKEALIEPKPIVKKCTYDMSSVKFTGETETVYDGVPHGLEVSKNLPDGVELASLTYFSEKGEEISGMPVDAGNYKVIAIFQGDERNFNKIEDLQASLIILPKTYSLPKIESRQYTGQDIDFTPQLVAENSGLLKLSVDGVVASDCSDCFIKREAGSYAVTVEIISPNIIFEGEKREAEISFTITKKIIEIPQYTGEIHYTGNSLLPSAEDFENFDSAIMVMSPEKSQSGRGAGGYFAVVALKDGRNYSWRTDAAVKSSDDNLSESEIRIGWTVERAVISASRAQDKMPFVFSESYKGSFENVIGYRYYVDEKCSQGVLFADLQDGERYFVCADLIDTDNFVLDKAAAEIFEEPFSYTAHVADSDLLTAVARLSEKNRLIFIAGACILGFAVLLLVALSAVAGFVVFKKVQKQKVGATAESTFTEKSEAASIKETAVPQAEKKQTDAGEGSEKKSCATPRKPRKK